ncbi:MDR family MFS transporter [Aliivibrio kagoshimensis]|uniref:MDR family MFS transporter n=1 Tax=Aliivibrio kagoshimensis TaxID=2910230 RepID=UPI003D0AD84B
MNSKVDAVEKDNMLQLTRLTRFNTTIWTVLIGTLLARTTYFMAWPFLIVILYQDYNISAISVGSMFAVSAIIGSVTGLYSGYLSDKFGRKWVMVLGCIIAAISYSGIGFAHSITQFAILIAGCGLMRPMIEAPAKAVISDNLDDLKDRELALNIRYFIINIGGAIGPLIGITLALEHPQILFWITGVTYVVFAVLLLIAFGRHPEKIQQHDGDVISLKQTIKIISKDSVFIKLLLANILMMFVYGQYESSIPQVIVRSGIEDAAKFISALVLVNTCTIILFQFPMLKLLQNVRLYQRTKIGMILMGVSQIGFLLVPIDWPVGWLIACFVLSVGEVIAFPTLNVQIDQIAPAHLRGSYFGAASIYSLGFAMAPFIGGVIIQLLGASQLFIFCFGISILMIWLYGIAEKEIILRQNS